MMEMEFIQNDYPVFLDIPQPNPKKPDEPNQPGGGDGITRSTPKEPDSRKPWWSLEFYQGFYDVTTVDIMKRLHASMMPWPSENFLFSVLQDNPDLYGPFWICTTLAIETGLSSYAAYYNHNYGHRSWRQTVRTVYQTGVLLFLYCWCLPTMLWIGLEWNPLSTYKFRLLELWCVFGYASSILLPAVAIWAAPVIWIRWLVANLAFFVSGVFICRYLKKSFDDLQRSSYYTVQVLFFVLNYVVGCSLVVLFFPSKFHNPDILSGTFLNFNLSTAVPLISTDFVDSVTEVHIQNVTGLKIEHSHNITQKRVFDVL